MLLRLAAIALISFQFAVPALADVTYIDCPISQVRKEITSPIASPWRQEPEIKNLDRLWVRGSGRDQELFCGYGSSAEGYLAISRRIPRDVMTCWPEDLSGTRFVCDIRYLVRKLVIPRSADIDLDNGEYGDNPAADFWLEVLPGNERYFVLKDGVGAAVARRGPAPPHTAPYRCNERLEYRSNRISVGDLPEGSVLCMRTNQENYSRVRIEKIDPPEPKLLVLSHVSRNSEGRVVDGTLRVPPSVPFDLDEGQLGESPETDILLHQRGFLEPLHGSRIAIADLDPPVGRGIACDDTFEYRTRRVRVNILQERSVLCVRTSRGTYSKIIVQARDSRLLVVLIATVRDQ